MGECHACLIVTVHREARIKRCWGASSVWLTGKNGVGWKRTSLPWQPTYRHVLTIFVSFFRCKQFFLYWEQTELSASFTTRKNFYFSHLWAGALMRAKVATVKARRASLAVCLGVLWRQNMSTCKTPPLLKTTQKFNSWQPFCLLSRANLWEKKLQKNLKFSSKVDR